MKPLTEAQRKRLTLYLGECWHERSCNVPASGIVYRCVKCKTAVYPISEHTFTTYEDLGKLKERLVENGEWDLFCAYAAYVFAGENDLCGKQITPEMLINFTAWLLSPKMFCGLVAEFTLTNLRIGDITMTQ